MVFLITNYDLINLLILIIFKSIKIYLLKV